MYLSKCLCWSNSLLSDKKKPYKWTDIEARQKCSLPGKNNEEWRCASIWPQPQNEHKNRRKEERVGQMNKLHEKDTYIFRAHKWMKTELKKMVKK